MTDGELTLHHGLSTHAHTEQAHGGKRTVSGRDHHGTVFTSQRQDAFGHSCSICDHQGSGTVFKCRCLCTLQVTGHDKVSGLKAGSQVCEFIPGHRIRWPQFTWTPSKTKPLRNSTTLSQC